VLLRILVPWVEKNKCFCRQEGDVSARSGERLLILLPRHSYFIQPNALSRVFVDSKFVVIPLEMVYPFSYKRIVQWIKFKSIMAE
jgi:hypothetical protein